MWDEAKLEIVGGAIAAVILFANRLWRGRRLGAIEDAVAELARLQKENIAISREEGRALREAMHIVLLEGKQRERRLVKEIRTLPMHLEIVRIPLAGKGANHSDADVVERWNSVLKDKYAANPACEMVRDCVVTENGVPRECVMIYQWVDEAAAKAAHLENEEWMASIMERRELPYAPSIEILPVVGALH